MVKFRLKRNYSCVRALYFFTLQVSCSTFLVFMAAIGRDLKPCSNCPCPGQESPALDQVAQRPIEPGLKHLQGLGMHHWIDSRWQTPRSSATNLPPRNWKVHSKAACDFAPVCSTTSATWAPYLHINELKSVWLNPCRAVLLWLGTTGDDM